MSDLPPYSGNKSCPECGAGMYAAETTVHTGTETGCPFQAAGEHLCRTCCRCDYTWAEAYATAGERVPRV